MQDQFYEKSKKNNNIKFHSLVEKAMSIPTIITAIHNLKSNKGSKTAGVDRHTIKKYLEQNYDKTIAEVQQAFVKYQSQEVRRVWIPKAGKKELRPLGIPTIIDRIVQECIRIIIEPICEGKFFEHSYGFRPMRSTHQALERLTSVVHLTGYHWVVEGDISKFFDKVNHHILIKELHKMGIADKRLLMIIKQMLKAGIMNETKVSELGTPQGGILSPLFANVYLNGFDRFVDNSWRNFKTKHCYSTNGSKLRQLKEISNLKPAYLVRYADDWCLVTDSRENAIKWKFTIEKWLAKHLKLDLSKDKTLITNIRKKKVSFLGFSFKVRKSGNASKGFISHTEPDKKRLLAKKKELAKQTKELRLNKNTDDLINKINLLNSAIRGIINYYAPATNVSVALGNINFNLTYTAYKSLKKFGGKWIRANRVLNLKSIHESYSTQIPSIPYKDGWIGVTSLIFCKWSKARLKNQEETPYSPEGRKIHNIITGKKPLKVRADELLSSSLSELVAKGLTRRIYNFEYCLNRPYAFNVDKGKCRICKVDLHKDNVHVHHVRPYLPLKEVNKVKNLATTCISCHKMIHNNTDYTGILDLKQLKKLNEYREKLIK